MSDSSDNDFLRKVFTVVTAPIWVPVAAVGGVVYGVGKGIDTSNDVSKKEGALLGIAATPFITAGLTVAGPFQGIAKVGESMWGKD